MNRNHRNAFIMCLAVLFGLIALAEPVFAGQQRQPASPIPGRVLKVREGDWVLMRSGDMLMKETALKIERIEPEGKPGDEAWFEPIYMVHYRLEQLDGETGRPVSKPMEVVRALEHEIEENLEMVRSMQGRPQRRKIRIGDKTVNVVVIPVMEDGMIVENLFTDDFGIDGRAGVIVRSPDGKDSYSAMEVVAFGNGRQQVQIQRFLKKKGEIEQAQDDEK